MASHYRACRLHHLVLRYCCVVEMHKAVKGTVGEAARRKRVSRLVQCMQDLLLIVELPPCGIFRVKIVRKVDAMVSAQGRGMENGGEGMCEGQLALRSLLLLSRRIFMYIRCLASDAENQASSCCH